MRVIESVDSRRVKTEQCFLYVFAGLESYSNQTTRRIPGGAFPASGRMHYGHSKVCIEHHQIGHGRLNEKDAYAWIYSVGAEKLGYLHPG